MDIEPVGFGSGDSCRKKYILDWKLLRSADVVLTGDKTVVSLAVKMGTLGKFSHAAICVGGSLIEATLAGVFSKNPQRLLFDSPRQVRVLRWKENLSDEDVLKICSYAQSKVGSLYSIDEAVTMKIRSTLQRPETNRQFCSRLVAQAFTFAGFSLDNVKNPAYCTPQQLVKCSGFISVEGLVRVANDSEIKFANSLDPVLENFKQTYEWLNKVRDLVRSDRDLSNAWDIQTVNDVLPFLTENPQFDNAVSSYLISSGYLNFYRIEEINNPHRFSLNLFMQRLHDVDDAAEMIDDELEKENAIIYRFSRMMQAFVGHLGVMNLKYSRLHLELYINLVEGILLRMSIIKQAILLSERLPEVDPVEFEEIDAVLDFLKLNIAHARELLSKAAAQNDLSGVALH